MDAAAARRGALGSSLLLVGTVTADHYDSDENDDNDDNE